MRYAAFFPILLLVFGAAALSGSRACADELIFQCPILRSAPAGYFDRTGVVHLELAETVRQATQVLTHSSLASRPGASNARSGAAKLLSDPLKALDASGIHVTVPASFGGVQPIRVDVGSGYSSVGSLDTSNGMIASHDGRYAVALNRDMGGNARWSLLIDQATRLNPVSWRLVNYAVGVGSGMQISSSLLGSVVKFDLTVVPAVTNVHGPFMPIVNANFEVQFK